MIKKIKDFYLKYNSKTRLVEIYREPETSPFMWADITSRNGIKFMDEMVANLLERTYGLLNQDYIDYQWEHYENFINKVMEKVND